MILRPGPGLDDRPLIGRAPAEARRNRSATDDRRAGSLSAAPARRDAEIVRSLSLRPDRQTRPSRRPKASGTAALREVWGGYLQREAFTAVYTPTIHVSQQGDMAYDIGHYRISMKKEGVPVSFEGKYVVVWELIDGRWKAVLDMDNDDGPPGK